MPLVRADGLPTQHMRALAYWSAAPELDDVISLQVCGTEWVAHVTCRRQLIDDARGRQRQRPRQRQGRRAADPRRLPRHGRPRRSRSITSSKEGALLIDDLIEWVEAEIEADPERAAVRARPPAPDRIAVAGRARLLPPAADLQAGRLRAREAAASPTRAASAGTWLGPRPSAAAARRWRRSAPAMTPTTASRFVQSQMYRRHLRCLDRRLRRRPAGPLPLPLRPLVPRGGALARGRAGGAGGPRAGRARARAGGRVMRTLLVDNHDSYTYNVFHLLAAASGEEPVVVNNDAVSWRVLSRSDFDAIVLSPGPGPPGTLARLRRLPRHPPLQRDPGASASASATRGSATCSRAASAAPPMPMHGRLSHVRHDGTGIFEGVPQDFSVVRYHSLAITGPIGPEGHVTAWADDGVVMGIEHRTRPIWGVQFHPESIATEHGRQIAENFYAMAERRTPQAPIAPGRARQPRSTGPDPSLPCISGPSTSGEAQTSEAGLRLVWRTLEGEAPTEHALRTALRRRRARRSGSTAPTRRPGWRSAPTSGPAPARDRCVLDYDVDAGVIDDQPRRRRHVAHKLDLRPARPRARGTGDRAAAGSAAACRRLRRLPRLRAEGRLRLAQRAQLRPARRGADARQPGRRRRPRRRPHLRLRARPRGRPRRRALAGGGERSGRGGDRRAAGAAAAGAATRTRRPRQLPRRPRPRAVPRRHRPLAGRTGRRRVLRGLPHRPDLDRRQPRPLRPLPPPAPQQPGARSPPSCASASARSSAPRRSASSRSTATAGRRRARSRGRSRAPTTRPRTPPARPSWPRTKRPAPST